MPRSRWWAIALGAIMVAACGQPTVSSRPARSFSTAAVTYLGFSESGGQPSDFINAYSDVADPPAWLYPGDWSLLAEAPGFVGPVLHQAETGVYPHIMIQRYAGAVFGADGQLPAHYKVSLAVQPFESSDRFPPVGENAVLVYYKDPTTYVEVTISNNNVSVWSSTHATPLASEGWQDHFYYPTATAPGDIRRIACEVDTEAQQLTFWVEGQQAATLSMPMLTDAGFHGFALRSHGNPLNFGELKIEGYTAVVPIPEPFPVLIVPEITPVPPPEPTLIPESPPEPVVVPTGEGANGHHPKGKAWGYWRKQQEPKKRVSAGKKP